MYDDPYPWKKVYQLYIGENKFQQCYRNWLSKLGIKNHEVWEICKYNKEEWDKDKPKPKLKPLKPQPRYLLKMLIRPRKIWNQTNKNQSENGFLKLFYLNSSRLSDNQLLLYQCFLDLVMESIQINSDLINTYIGKLLNKY